MFIYKSWALYVLVFLMSFYANAESLYEILELAFKNSASILAANSQLDAEKHKQNSILSLEDPIIGVSTLNRNIETQYGTITQKFRFPVKYYYENSAQKSRVSYFSSKLEFEKLSLQSQIIINYYSIYTAQKIIQLTEANMQAVKEFARVAEKKYAAGSSPQGDSMKAHFELTQLELELLRLKQEEDALQVNLKTLVNSFNFKDIDLTDLELPLPTIRLDDINTTYDVFYHSIQKSSPLLQSDLFQLKETESRRSLSKWEFAPDFQIQYQHRISGDPEDSKIYSLGMTFPLWFWRKSAEASVASANYQTQEYKLRESTLKLISISKDLIGKVNSGVKILKIYETSLIPQAQGAYKSARASYQASKTSFLDLLDSERSLYRVRTGYYQSFKQYIENLSQLEVHLGWHVSNLVVNKGK